MGDGEQSFVRPRQEAIDGHRGQKSGKTLRPQAQSGAHWRAAQNDVQVASDLLQEEPPTQIPRIHQTKGFDLLKEIEVNSLFSKTNFEKFYLISDSLDDVVNFIVGKEAGDLSSCQKVVNGSEQSFVDELGIGDQQDGRQFLEAGFETQSGKIRPQFRDAVARPSLKLSHIVAGHRSGQTGEALLSASADTHQKGVPSRQFQDSIDPVIQK